MATWTEKIENHYSIGSIVPFDYALSFAESLDRDEVTEEYINKKVEVYKSNKKLFSNRLSYKSVGARREGGYRLMFKNKKAFGDWVFVKSNGRVKGSIYAWNPKTQERIWMNSFELYLVIIQYTMAAFNAQHINIDGTSNPEPFNKPIF